MLHCDIKPDNIFLGIGFEPILIDLGSARWHVPGVGVEEPGTYSYYFSAIEQVDARFGSVGPWTDIYQLSAVLYRCMTGGKLPDAMDRAAAKEDPFVPLSEIPDVVSVYPDALIDAVDHGTQGASPTASSIGCCMEQHYGRSVAASERRRAGRVVGLSAPDNGAKQASAWSASGS